MTQKLNKFFMRSCLYVTNKPFYIKNFCMSLYYHWRNFLISSSYRALSEDKLCSNNSYMTLINHFSQCNAKFKKFLLAALVSVFLFIIYFREFCETFEWISFVRWFLLFCGSLFSGRKKKFGVWKIIWQVCLVMSFCWLFVVFLMRFGYFVF